MTTSKEDAGRSGTSSQRLDRSNDTFAYLLMLVSATCWAGNHITGRWMASAEPPVPPGGLSVVRWLLAAVVLLPFAWKGLKADWPHIQTGARPLLFLGLVGGAAFSFLQYYGLRYTSAVNVGVMNSVGPALIILAGIMLFRDRVRPLQLAGVGISLAGVLIILMRGDPSVLGALAFNAGDLIAFLNMGIFAIYSACLRTRPAISGLSFLTVMSVIAALGCVPVAIVETMLGNPVLPTWPTVLSVVYTGIFTSVIAYLAWNAGVQMLGSHRAGAFLHLVPLIGAVLSVVLLGEEPRLFHAAGFMLIVAGVSLAARR